MRRLYWIAFILAFPFTAFGQFFISQPIDRGVYQRNGNSLGSSATVVLAGQYTGTSVPSYRIEYSIYRLSVNDGSFNSIVTNWTTITNNPSFGIFRQVISLSTGWYSAQMRAVNTANNNIIGSNSVRFGVGDVYMIAGQSNAQGVPEGGGFGSWSLPSVTPYDGVVSHNLQDNCNQNLPAKPVMYIIDQYSRIAPNGSNAWCWSAAGNQLAQAGSTPIAFFNAAYGGSTIENWRASSQNQPTNSIYTGQQYCGGGKVGQPYRALRNALQFYGGIFGAKTVLWHQGEADNDKQYNSLTSTADYQTKLQTVIGQSRTDFSSNLRWLVSRVSFVGNNPTYGGSTTRNELITAQNNVIASNSSQNYAGPSTDDLGLDYRDVDDKVHFRENRNGALSSVAGRWVGNIQSAVYSPIAAVTSPIVTMTKLGSQYQISVVPSTFNEYRWTIAPNFDINSSLGSGSSIIVNGGQSYACYVRSGNTWTISPTVFTSCGSCRSAANEWSEEEVGIQTKAYPNPARDYLTIEFTIPSESKIRLELLDQKGVVIQQITDAYHTNGTFKYPVRIGSLGSAMYFYRLSVNGLAITKKIIKAE